MKDPLDKTTIDALEQPRKRGRPATGAMTPAEKQKAYRERKKTEQSGIELSERDLLQIVWALDDYTKSVKIFHPEQLGAHDELRERIRKIYKSKIRKQAE